MKKNFKYVASAIALGIVLMLTTFWFFSSETGYDDVPNRGYTPLAEAAQTLKGFSNVTGSPRVNVASLSLMLTLSIVCALGVTLYFKKKTM